MKTGKIYNKEQQRFLINNLPNTLVLNKNVKSHLFISSSSETKQNKKE